MSHLFSHISHLADHFIRPSVGCIRPNVGCIRLIVGRLVLQSRFSGAWLRCRSVWCPGWLMVLHSVISFLAVAGYPVPAASSRVL
jgi:hypothetical protein